MRHVQVVAVMDVRVATPNVQIVVVLLALRLVPEIVQVSVSELLLELPFKKGVSHGS